MGSSAEEKNPWTCKYVKEITQTKTQREIKVKNQPPPQNPEYLRAILQHQT